jgi:hypothetical protein
MRIRCSTGLRISAFFGHFFIRSTDLLALPACDTDKVCVQGGVAGLGELWGSAGSNARLCGCILASVAR